MILSALHLWNSARRIGSFRKASTMRDRDARFSYPSPAGCDSVCVSDHTML